VNCFIVQHYLIPDFPYHSRMAKLRLVSYFTIVFAVSETMVIKWNSGVFLVKVERIERRNST
jgi:hypothetical protein